MLVGVTRVSQGTKRTNMPCRRPYQLEPVPPLRCLHRLRLSQIHPKGVAAVVHRAVVAVAPPMEVEVCNPG